MFNLRFPDAVSTPLEPTCSTNNCLGSIICTSETGRIVATLVSPCAQVDADISFTVTGVTNPPTMVPTWSFGGYYDTKLYNRVANFSGSVAITNEFMADIENKTHYIH
jgi:hypothetical protein